MSTMPKCEEAKLEQLTTPTLAETFLAEQGFESDFLYRAHFIRPDDLLIDGSPAIITQALIRRWYIERFGFAILTRSTVNAIVDLGPFLEIGCGTGYWAHELRLAGAEVVATDPKRGKRNPYPFKFQRLYTHIDKVDGVTAAHLHPHHTLLCVWPSYDEPWAADALDAYQGDRVIYVGEGSGGCTADDRFHKLLDEHWKKQAVIAIPQFFGIHDELTVYHRR